MIVEYVAKPGRSVVDSDSLQAFPHASSRSHHNYFRQSAVVLYVHVYRVQRRIDVPYSLYGGISALDRFLEFSNLPAEEDKRRGHDKSQAFGNSTNALCVKSTLWRTNKHLKDVQGWRILFDVRYSRG